MDNTDRKIIEILAKDSRRALADIGQAVGLSASAVNERIRRLVAGGTIRAFTVDADPGSLGLPVLAFLQILLARGADEAAFRDWIAAQSEVSECHHVTGAWSYLLKVRSASLAALEDFLSALKHAGYCESSETVIALSHVVPDRFAPAPGTA